MFTPYTTMLNAKPGQMTIHGALNMNRRPLPLSMPPQLGAGGGMPKPRKLSEASPRITPGTASEKLMMMGARMLGRMCLSSTLDVEPPMAIEASRYEFSLMLMTTLREKREPPIPPDTPLR